MKDIIEKMTMEEFVHLCNRLVMEMGFKIRNSVYRENIAVFDAYMPLPGKSLHYVIIFMRKPKVGRDEILDMIDVETVEVRWMIIITGEFENVEDLRKRDDLTLMEWKDFERLLREFGLEEEMRRPERGKEIRESRILPSVGELESMLQWAEEFLEDENYDKALEYVESAIRIKPIPRALKLKARILEKMGRYEEALSILKEVLEADVKDDEAWLLLGEVLEDMEDFEEAAEAYSQCVRFNHRNMACWINRGNVMLFLEKYQEALMCYEKALTIRQDVPQVWNNRGVALKQLGQYDDALKSYNIAIDMDPNFADAYLNKAYLYFDLRKYEEALNAIEEYIKRREDTRGYLLLARIYIKRNMKKEAKETLEKILRIEPGNQDAKELLDRLEGRGREERELKRLREKIKAVEKALYKEIEDLKKRYDGLGKESKEIESMLKETKDLVDGGEVEKAVEALMALKEKLYQLELQSLRRMVERDTMMLLELADMSAENIDELSLKELEILREDAMKRILISKIEVEEVKGGEEGMDIGELQKLQKEILKEVDVGGEEYRGLAHILYEESNWKELRKIKDEYAYNALGLKYIADRKYKRAVEYFVKALTKNPGFKVAEFNLAYALMKRGEKRKAKALLKHLGIEEYMEKMLSA